MSFLHPSGITEVSPVPITISDDTGGLIDAYDRKFMAMQASGASFRIAHECLSACGIYMRLPRVCAMPRAHFGFHSVYDGDTLRLMPEVSLNHAILTSLPAAYDLQLKYAAHTFGFSTGRHLVEWKMLEPGVFICYRYYSTAPNGEDIYQKMLMVEAKKFIPECT